MFRVKCGHCNGKGFVSPLMKQLYGDCGNCHGTGWVTGLSDDDVAWLKAHDPERLEEVADDD